MILVSNGIENYHTVSSIDKLILINLKIINMKSENNTGIWIDGKKAVIVQLHNEKETVETILSDIEGHERIEGEGKQFTRMGKQFFSFEKNKEEKHKHQLNGYFKNVLNKIKDADAIMIIGPAETKQGLHKLLSESKTLSKKLVLLEAEDHLTDNQVAAKVREFYKTAK